jgi:hypothetical protein
MTGHLIHIGFPKTGTNYLRRWYAAHPQLAYVDGRIAGFQDVYSIVRQGAAPRPEVRYRVTSCEGLAMPSPSFGLPVVGGRTHWPWSKVAGAQATVCTMLAELFPSARVLVLTRGYRSMIVSSYSQYVRTGGEADFDQYCAVIADSGNPWQYDRLLALYEPAFGASNVIVMPYELLRDDVDAFTRALEERLGIDHHAAPPERVNAGVSPEEMAWYPRLSRVVEALPIGGTLRRLYARNAFVNRFRHPIRLLQRLHPRRPVTAAMIPEALLDALRPGAERLRTYPLYEPYAADYLG